MKVELTAAALRDYIDAEPAVRKAFDKPTRLLLENLRHPSLRAKKYDEASNIWQARVNRAWRLYFIMTADTYLILNLTPHPK
jgi:plasmid maintenance system killer protein